MNQNRTSEANRYGFATPQSAPRGAWLGSGTSERRTSFFGRRTSGIGTFATDLYGACGGSEKIKDPRPLHDKSFVQQCIRQLCEFLGDNGYPQSISVKSLQSPTSKEFVKIFSFMFSLIDSSYQLPDSKFEEEIPRIFKLLGYPFPLSKSSMYTVGAPHTWPQILGALIWLIDVVKLTKSINPDKILFGPEKDWDEVENVTADGVHHNRLFLSYVSKCYSRHLAGIDDHEDLDLENLALLKQHFGVDEAQFEEVAAENRKLSEELNKLEKEKQNEPDRVQALEKTKASLQADREKYKKYLEEMENHKATLEQRAKEIEEEIEATALELNAVKEENKRLQQIYDRQENSAVDAMKMNREKNELHQTLMSLSESLEDADKRMWKEEINVSKAKEMLEIKLQEYHTMARKLKLIPKTAENARGRDFEISLMDIASGKRDFLQKTLTIRHDLVALLKEQNKEMQHLRNKLMNVQEANEQVQAMIDDKANDLKMLTEQIRKVDGTMEQKKEEDDRKMAKQVEELESLENKKRFLQKTSKTMKEELDEAIGQLKAAKYRADEVELKITEAKRKAKNDLHFALETMIQHVTIIENYLEDYQRSAARDHEELLKEDFLKDLQCITESCKEKSNSVCALAS
ncbi:kinetochore protein NDC80 homolog [Hypanus sabinus]|uniref:kinetochore protein NDC80 homolog n=1 Tax=Hypanus sabinus TaxID=79690 RepID=UPI0028C4C6AA|nr:kinetochore protein NDC80 homolog [Hypanus sabinus]XP_059830907.1 kinetochore protein NDC80 homolog [Hypanus sabinus]XP_059830988.1 kinetochore protein NDC80 homolog [Hypanus sabinus]